MTSQYLTGKTQPHEGFAINFVRITVVGATTATQHVAAELPRHSATDAATDSSIGPVRLLQGNRLRGDTTRATARVEILFSVHWAHA
jgi:hypothetical protein